MHAKVTYLEVNVAVFEYTNSRARLSATVYFEHVPGQILRYEDTFLEKKKSQHLSHFHASRSAD